MFEKQESQKLKKKAENIQDENLKMLFMRHVFFTLAEPLNNLSMLPMATAEEQEVQWPPLKHQRAHERFVVCCVVF